MVGANIYTYWALIYVNSYLIIFKNRHDRHLNKRLVIQSVQYFLEKIEN